MSNAVTVCWAGARTVRDLVMGCSGVSADVSKRKTAGGRLEVGSVQQVLFFDQQPKVNNASFGASLIMTPGQLCQAKPYTQFVLNVRQIGEWSSLGGCFAPARLSPRRPMK